MMAGRYFLLVNSLPITVTASEEFNKAALIAVMDDQSLSLNYWEKNERVERFPLVVCCPRLVSAMALECSTDSKVLFVGGSDKFDVTQGKPIIAALSFDKHLRQLAVLELSEKQMLNIFKIKRISLANDNILLISGFNAISIVYYNQSLCAFQELKTLGGLHEGEIFDFTLYKNTIYSVGGRDPYIHRY
jgi:hypothetical protein